MDAQILLTRCIEQEEFYRFPEFSQENVWELAQDLVAASETFEGPLALEIELGGVMVFRYYPAGTGLFHEQWLKRKRNTVNVLEKSSLRVYAELEIKGEDLEKDMCLNPADYAACGGGFPLRLKNGCRIGFIGASGLPHTKDHGAIIEGLRRYFQRHFPELGEGPKAIL